MITEEQISALAPDAGSAKRGEAQAKPAKWTGLGLSDGYIYGYCKGSGKNPYKTQIEISGPAYKCACPSRQFPCKHAIGLMYLFAREPDRFTEAPPDWVIQWRDSRVKKAETAGQKAAPAPKKTNEKTAAKRAAAMTEGAARLEQWLEDGARQGMAALAAGPRSVFADMEKLLVDAKAPGLARKLYRLSRADSASATGLRDMAEAFGELHYLVKAFQARELLDPALRADVEALAGVSLNKDQILAQAAPVADAWTVMAAFVEDSMSGDRLHTRYVWLRGGRTKRYALLLDFAHGAPNFPFAFAAGQTFEAELAYYPSAAPLRAVIANEAPKPAEPVAPPDYLPALDAFLEEYAAVVARQPFIEDYPCALKALRIDDTSPVLRGLDAEGAVVPFLTGEFVAEVMQCFAGTEAVDVFGVWRGGALVPLTLRNPNGRLLELTHMPKPETLWS